MQETFEHKISHQLDDFKLQPSPMVWQEVDAALHPERKKRFIIWWWLGAVVIGMCLTGYWFVYHQNAANSKKEMASNERTYKPLESSSKNILPTRTKKEANKPFIIDKEVVISTERYQKALFKKTNTITPNYQQTASTNGNKIGKEALNTKNNISLENADNVIVSNSNLNQLTQTNTPTLKQNDSTVTNTKANQSAEANKPIEKDKKAAKKSHWLVSIGGGILKTMPTSNTKSLASANSSVGSGGFNGATNTNQPAITSPQTGFNVNVGIAYNTDLGKKWQVQAGLHYHYLTNKHNLKADTSTGFTNSFVANNNSIITNKAHWLQMPFTFAYNLQPKSKHPINVLLGGSLAYVISEKWLISNSSTGRFYYDASLNNRWLLGVHSGVSYTISPKLNVSALASYTLTPIQSQVTDKNHFLQYNFQLSTPINFSNTKKSKK